MRAGLSPDTEEDVITRRLYGNPFAWGITLIVIGTLFLLHTLLGVQLPVRQLLPVALVALGAYMLFDYVRRRRSPNRIVRFDSRRPPPSVVVESATIQNRGDDSVWSKGSRNASVQAKLIAGIVGGTKWHSYLKHWAGLRRSTSFGDALWFNPHAGRLPPRRDQVAGRDDFHRRPGLDGVFIVRDRSQRRRESHDF